MSELTCRQPTGRFTDDTRCDKPAVAFDLRMSGWLPVCEQHAYEDSIRIMHTDERPWWRRLLRLCRHERVRCIHGDEILSAMTRRGVIRRQRCLDCGRALAGDLPNPCTTTNKPHLSQRMESR